MARYRPPAARPAGGGGGGIEALIRARRGDDSLPTREELQERTSQLTAHLAMGSRKSTPGEVIAEDAVLQQSEPSRPSTARQLSMQEFEQALAAVEEGIEQPAPPPTAGQMATAIRERLGFEAAPLSELVERASAVLGLDFEDGATLIVRLQECYDVAVAEYEDAAPTYEDVAQSSYTTSVTASAVGTSLLDGVYDEEESSAGFQAALAAFRGEAPPEPRKKKGPPLGERLLAKGLVSGCSA